MMEEILFSLFKEGMENINNQKLPAKVDSDVQRPAIIVPSENKKPGPS